MEIVQAYGHQGPQAGDELVADLLQRTVDGQWGAQEALNDTIAEFSAIDKPLVLTELPLMTVRFAQLLAELRWEMATAFLDGVVVTHREASTLPKNVYAFGDALADKARNLTQQAIQVHANRKNGGKVRLISADVLEDYVLNGEQVNGAWSAYEVIVATIDAVITSVIAEQRPSRFSPLIDPNVRQARAKIEAFRLLQKEWHATRLSNNKLELARDASVYVKDLYALLQQFWAPYLLGSEYAEVLKQKATLAELSVTDPWVLTDRLERATKQGSTEENQRLADFWASLQDVPATIRLAEQVQELLGKRMIRRTGVSYPNVPWPSQFLVKYAITVGGTTFESGELVAFYASSDALGRIDVQLRRTGKLTRIADLLGAS